MSAADATWEPLEGFRAAHPSFQLEDELFVEGGAGGGGGGGGGAMLWLARCIHAGTNVAADEEQVRRAL
jgi:hypothetical protein